MKISTRPFLYEGSHFLPKIRPQHIQDVLKIFESYNNFPISIAKSQAEISKEFFLIYCKDQETFNNAYQVKTVDVEVYYAGFEIPLHIICNSNIKALSKSGIVFDPISTNYIAEACLKFKTAISKSTPKNYLFASMNIFDYCLTYLLTVDDFYEMGIIASQTIFREFSQQLGVS